MLADLILILIIGVVYWPSVHGRFLFDDVVGIERMPGRVRSLREPSEQGWKGEFWWWYVRRAPLTWLTLQKNFDWSEYSTRGYHLTNMAIHGANVILARHVLEHWLTWERALMAAAIFAVHPLQVPSVAYISGRFSILATFFILVMIEVFFSGQWWLLPLAFYLGLRSKEDARVAPLLIGGLWLIAKN